MSARRDWTVVLVSVTAVALVAAVGGVSIHQNCFEPIAGPPETGSARGAYCNAVNPTHPWLSLIVLPVLVMTIVALGCNSRKRVVYGVAAILAVALLVNALIVGGLKSHSGI